MEETERKNRAFIVCGGTIGHRPLWGRCPKRGEKKEGKESRTDKSVINEKGDGKMKQNLSIRLMQLSFSTSVAVSRNDQFPATGPCVGACARACMCACV